jgi:hypothetical protein
MAIEYLQLGAVAFVFLFFILKFFDYLKCKKNGNGEDTKIDSILKQVTLTNNNHLHTIEDKIDKIDDCIGNIRERLTMVETKLDN